MAGSQLLRLGSVVNKKGGVLAASRHNKRTAINKGEHIDSTRSHLNYCLAGETTPEAIATHAKVQMLIAGIETPRKNGVMAVEAIFSLPIDRHSQDTRQFFADCHAWTLKTFPCEMLSFDVHLDEAAPHAHALILPLIDGKMQGDKLKGDRGNINRLNELFYDEIGKCYGLSKHDYMRLSSQDRQSIEHQVVMLLKDDPVMKSAVYACVRDLIHKDPMPFAEMLSITAPAKRKPKEKSFVQIMTSKGKGKTYETQNPI